MASDAALDIAIADVNDDNKPDYATANPSTPAVSVRLGHGDGTFGPRTDYPTGANLRAIAFALLDAGIHQDLVVVTETTVSVRLGNGDGSFGPASNVAALGGKSVAAADLNEDGNQDLVVTLSNQVAVMLGNGNGTFSSPVAYTTGTHPLDVAIALMNADSHLDLVTANESFSMSVLPGNGDGTFGPSLDTALPAPVYDVAIGDLDGVGGRDVCLGSTSGAGGGFMLYRLLGNGDGTFGSPLGFAPGPSVSYAVALADFNHDGKTDLAAAQYVIVPALSVFLGNGDGTFGPETEFATGPTPEVLAAGDLNGDDDPDIITADFYSGAANVHLGNGDGTFGSPRHLPAGVSPKSVVIADLNHDSYRDLTVANSGSNTVSTMLGNGDGTFAAKVDHATGPKPGPAAVADVNADTHPDLIVANTYAGQVFPPYPGAPPPIISTVSVLLGNGNGTFGPKTDFNASYQPASMALGDLDGVGGPDIVLATYGDGIPFGTYKGIVYVLLGHGDGTFAPGVRYDIGSDPGGVALGDFNGDGNLDVAATNRGPTPVLILLGYGNGTLAPAVGYGSGSSFNTVAAGDLNGDGWIDLVLDEPPDLLVLFGNGAGAFGPQMAYPVPAASSIAIDDLDGDGVADVAAASSFRSLVSVMKGNGDGTLGAPFHYGTGWKPASVAVGDLTGDDLPEIVTADESWNAASVLINRTGGPTATLLSMFAAEWAGSAIEVRWQFGAGSSVSGTTVERSESPGGPWAEIAGDRRIDGDAEVLVDTGVEVGRSYSYRLLARLANGELMTFGPISTAGEPGTNAFALMPMTPNPAHGSLRVPFVMPQAAPVRISVLDVLGRRAAVLVDEMLPAGRHEAVWEAAGRGPAPAGLYFVRFEWPGGSATRRLAITQ